MLSSFAIALIPCFLLFMCLCLNSLRNDISNIDHNLSIIAHELCSQCSPRKDKSKDESEASNEV
jgi:hypothetical protein